MRMRRALAWLCVLFCIWSSLFSAAFALEIPPDLDDLGIDPWGDLGLIQETPEPTPTVPIGEPAQMAPVDLEPAGEGGAVVYSLFPGSDTYKIQLSQNPYLRKYSFYPDSTASSSILRFTSDYERSVSTSDQLSAFNSGRLLISGASYSFSGGGTLKYGLNPDYGSYVDITQSKVVSGGIYSSISLNGTFTFKFTVTSPRSSSISSSDYVPTSVSVNNLGTALNCRFIVNGIPFGPIITPDSSGKFTVNNILIDISSLTGDTISSIGFRFYAKTGISSLFSTTLPSSGSRYIYYCLGYDDSALDLSWLKDDVGSGSTDNPGSSSEEDQERHEETVGLLGSIIQFLQNIVSGIGNIATAIVELPGKIANLIIDGIKSLFIPSEDDLNGLKDKYEALLSERLGFIWQAGEWITSFGSDLLSALSGGSDAEFVFPGVCFDMNGEHYQLIEQQTVDFDANGIVTVIRPFVGTIVALVVVAACVNLFHDMVGALISGKSYFDFLKGGGG